MLRGIGVAPGTAFGPLAVVAPPAGIDPDEAPCTDFALIEQVLIDVASNLSNLADEAATGTSISMLRANAALAKDRALLREIRREVERGAGATRAVHDATEVFAGKLRRLGGTMAERVTDLYDVRDRAIARLRNLPEPGVPALSVPSILVARDLAPAQTAGLDPRLVLGIVTEGGGPTSHTAILAAQMGIPAVAQVKGIMDVPLPASAILDGASGEVVVQPSDDDVRRIEKRAARRSEALAGASGGALPDVALLANVASVDDARRAIEVGAEGCGLLRTEFLYLDRTSAPSIDEQIDAYSEVLGLFDGRRAVVRVLDAGADKPLPFASLAREDNPALGLRGVRALRIREQLLDAQLHALASTSARVRECDLHVMAPMVSTAEEAHWFAARARERGVPSVGVMIETPAAAIRAADVLREVDFASIGTNDLGQYTMAADRCQGELAPLLDPWQPAVLSMIAAACRGAADTGTPIGVCGEAAGDPLLALVLVGLGASSLSMAPGRIPAVRAALASHDTELCRRIADAALSASTAASARDAALALSSPELRAFFQPAAE